MTINNVIRDFDMIYEGRIKSDKNALLKTITN